MKTGSKKKILSTSKERSKVKKRFSSGFFPRIKKRLSVYVIEGRFEIVKKICREIGHKVSTKSVNISESDLIWTDTGSSVEILGRMKHYQKTNHFPGTN